MSRLSRVTLLWLWVAALGYVLSGCEQSQAPQATIEYFDTPQQQVETSYRFAVHPLHNPRTLLEAYQPLIDYLSAHFPETRFELEASRNYQAYEAKLAQGSPHFILPNPWQTLQAMKQGYHVLAMAGNADDFKGIFIVRKDSGITQPVDLKGKTVSYPSHTALAAAIMPQYFLFQAGLDVNTDIKNAYVGSQESSIMNAYLGHSAAGATWPPPWRLFQKEHPEAAAELMVIWQTEPLMNNSVMARSDLPQELVSKVQNLLVTLHDKPEGDEVLKSMETARFYQANDESYYKVQRYIDQFEQDVRPVLQP